MAHRSLPPVTRRDALCRIGSGFGMMAFAGMLGESLDAAALAPQKAAAKTFKGLHHPAKAKHVIFLFMNGGLSQVDSFDPKPMLAKYHGQPLPGGPVATERKTGTLMQSPFTFSRYGKSGLEVSELFPNVGACADDICVIRSMHTDIPNHEPSMLMMNTGHIQVGRPSMGAWLTYGLGTENQDLPGYVTVNPSPNFGGAINYGSAFLPAHFQGTRVSDRGEMDNLRRASLPRAQRRQLDLIQAMNRDLAARSGAPDELDGVIQSFELAFRMQDRVPELLDISREPQSVLDEYGVRAGPEGSFARQCLMARRLSEAGVRFVEITQSGWDHHNGLHEGMIRQSRMVDRPTAALLADLERRGLLDETLVLFGSEFGRMPTAQGPDGRDHNITGYPMWLAGAGVKKGFSFGATDEYGLHAVEGRMHTTDLHATLLALMGLDHKELTYRYAGRDFRLTDVAGTVADAIFG